MGPRRAIPPGHQSQMLQGCPPLWAMCPPAVVAPRLPTGWKAHPVTTALGPLAGKLVPGPAGCNCCRHPGPWCGWLQGSATQLQVCRWVGLASQGGSLFRGCWTLASLPARCGRTGATLEGQWPGWAGWMRLENAGSGLRCSQDRWRMSEMAAASAGPAR